MIKRVLARLLVPLVAVGGLSVFVAQPALAATCNTNGHVYETIVSPFVYKFETDPLDGAYGPLYIDVANDGQAHSGQVRLGGNGLRPNSTPSWDVFNGGGGYVGVLNGNRTGGNCVSNEKTYPVLGTAGDVYLVKANYDTGNSNLAIRGQNHFFVQFY